MRFALPGPEARGKALSFATISTVTGLALMGQIMWGTEARHLDLPIAVWVAATVECTSLYVMHLARQAALAGLASLRKRLFAYGIGAGAGYLNWSHWSASASTAEQTMGIIFGVASLCSPILWNMRSQLLHRETLQDQGLLDASTVRLGLARWLMFPIQTWRCYRYAIENDITSPAEAWARSASLRKPATAPASASVEAEAQTEAPGGSASASAPRATAAATVVSLPAPEHLALPAASVAAEQISDAARAAGLTNPKHVQAAIEVVTAGGTATTRKVTETFAVSPTTATKIMQFVHHYLSTAASPKTMTPPLSPDA